MNKYVDSDDEKKNVQKEKKYKKSPKNKYIFYCKIEEGHALKSLITILDQSKIQTACFVINKDGIYLETTDTNKLQFFDLELSSDKFKTFKFYNNSSINLGLNIKDFNTNLKSIKKKDNVILYILNKEQPYTLFITSDKEGQKNEKKPIQSINVQPMSIEKISGYENWIVGDCKSFQEMIKYIKMIKLKKKQVNIDVYNTYIKFYTNNGYENIMGDNDEDDSKFLYTQKLNFEQLLPFIKIAGLSSKLKLYIPEDKSNPLKFKVDVGIGNGIIGKLLIYIKTIEEDKKDEETEQEIEINIS